MNAKPMPDAADPEPTPEYHPHVVTALKTMIVLFEAICLWGQVAMVALSGDVAAAYPEFAPARWPYAVAGIAGILCIEAALAAVWRLLALVRRRDVFSGRAVAWVNVVIGCALAEVVPVLFVLLYGSFARHDYYDPVQRVTVDVSMGTFALSVLCVVALLLIAAFVMLMLVMRSLLTQAIAQRRELEAVI